MLASITKHQWLTGPKPGLSGSTDVCGWSCMKCWSQIFPACAFLTPLPTHTKEYGLWKTDPTQVNGGLKIIFQAISQATHQQFLRSVLCNTQVRWAAGTLLSMLHVWEWWCRSFFRIGCSSSVQRPWFYNWRRLFDMSSSISMGNIWRRSLSLKSNFFMLMAKILRLVIHFTFWSVPAMFTRLDQSYHKVWCWYLLPGWG